MTDPWRTRNVIDHGGSDITTHYQIDEKVNTRALHTEKSTFRIYFGGANQSKLQIDISLL